MPLFAPETLIAQVVRMETVESSFGGFQIEMELEDPNPETGNRRNWIGIPETGKVTSRTILGWFVTQAKDAEKRFDGLDFRSPKVTQASVKKMCEWMTGQWYVWESREPELRGLSQQAKERWIPIKKFRSEEEALAAYVAENEGFEIEESPAGAPTVSDEVVNAALPLFVSAQKSGAVIRQLADSQWPGVDVDALIAALKAKAG